MPAKRYWISGRVQGVFFRASTRDRARELGLSGYVRNLPDGRVEVVASGEEEALERLEQFLAEGPRRARVEQVASEKAEQVQEDDFHVRR